ncbi:aquaporin-4 isoform X2 [Microcaecilia unicolor]|uniref:Aquaporin-4 n=1 Tax=Microcaecilia unicolor TaxID=1415580 RepID=A0A6P7Z281_9AMPH|nr:aquaporin-4 isoform X2 [Microcaecilia unicolor]
MCGRSASRGRCKCTSACKCDAIMVAFKGVWTQPFWKAVSAEFLGTLIFVFLGIGSTINWSDKNNPQPADLVLISLCFGLSIATMVQCFGHLSGAHINPAVTAAMVCTRKISLSKAIFYIIAQCLGAIAGAGLLYLATPSDVAGDLGITTINSKLSPGHGLLVEVIITFQLLFTIFASCDSKRDDVTGSVALAIGFSVSIGHLCAINYTGSSMNPARSLGPAVIIMKWENHWVYWLGPFLGAILAGAIYDYMYCPDAECKAHCKDVFSKTTQQSKGKYIEVDDNKCRVDADSFLLKPGIVRVISTDEKKDKDPTSEVLSSV